MLSDCKRRIKPLALKAQRFLFGFSATWVCAGRDKICSQVITQLAYAILVETFP
jgi:hypothetical protein